ncbi:hypothetical protein [Bacillus salipaludis]|uniref:UDP-glucose 4-epimerase n=1 Tax=Bacillus salipaludis TaxID=2547811 RepID=A0ABW8RM92_9BACI
MDKAVILGIYNFISFHFCKTLLNQGVEVVGVQIDELDKSPFLEEKRLEVGRNANFNEHSLTEWEKKRKEDTTQTTLIFSMYDLYMENKEIILQNEQITRPIIQFIEENKNNSDIVFILPIQMLRSKQEKTIEAFIEQVRGFRKNIQMFYLPAVYGQWQPPSFLFQQAILSTLFKTDIIKDEREWTGDVLFVDDAIETIIETIETGNHRDSMLESGRKNYWAECAAYLQLNEKIAFDNRDQSLQMDKQIGLVSVKKVTPFADSIDAQIEHVQRLFQNGL